MQQKLFNAFRVGILFVIFSVGMGIALASWVAPTSVPPGGNTPTPINTGSATQVKGGNLFLGVGNTFGATVGLFGQVGIGTTAPTASLDVNGDVNVRGSKINMGNSLTNFYGDGTNTAVRQNGAFYIQNTNGSDRRDLYTRGVFATGDTVFPWPDDNDDVATVGWVNSVLSAYATQSWVQSQGYATQSWVHNQGYATESWVNSRINAINYYWDYCYGSGAGMCANGYVMGGYYPDDDSSAAENFSCCHLKPYYAY